MQVDVDRFIDTLRRANLRVTTQRRAILETLLASADTHPTTSQLASAVQRTHPDIHATTVCCHVCGEYFRALGSHVRTHGYGAADYRRVMGLCRTWRLAPRPSRRPTDISELARLVGHSTHWVRRRVETDMLVSPAAERSPHTSR